MKIFIDAMSLAKGAGVACYIRNTIDNIPVKHEIIAAMPRGMKFKSDIEQIHPPLYNIWTRLIYEHIIFPLAAYVRGCDIMFMPKSYAPLMKMLPAVTTMHDMIPISSKWREGILPYIYWKLSFASSAYFSTGIIMITDIIKKRFKGKYRPAGRKISAIIHNGWDNYSRKSNASEKYILIPATVKRRKNILTACKLAEIIRDAYPGSEIVITGRIDDRILFNKIKSQYPSVTVKGYVSNRKMAHLFNNALIVIYLSRAEGYGLPVAEALYLGKMVVAYDNSINRHIYNDTPLYYNPIDSVETNAENIIGKMHNGKKKKIRYRTWKQTAEETAEFLEEICRRS